MRNALRDALMQRNISEEEIFLIVGDIGFGVFEEYTNLYPNNYLNIGICEANMIGFSAGMSMNGFIPIVYTIVPFLTMRPFEQIRIDLALHNRQVILVGVGGGLAYGSLGPTHHSFEDLSLMSVLPNFRVFAPSQPSESKTALDLAMRHKGPSYIRLGKNGEPNLEDYLFLKKPGYKVYNCDLESSDITVFTYGPITYDVILCAKKLMKNGIKASVVSFLEIKPIDKKIIDLGLESKKIFLIEEHSKIQSPMTYFISLLVENKCKKDIFHFGIEDRFTEEVGSRDFLLKYHGLDGDSLVKKIKDCL
tara:strand:- start:1138 stop:2055 length:918 start_codon:yes stop_codon:yes gene_type:complete